MPKNKIQINSNLKFNIKNQTFLYLSNHQKKSSSKKIYTGNLIKIQKAKNCKKSQSIILKSKWKSLLKHICNSQKLLIHFTNQSCYKNDSKNLFLLNKCFPNCFLNHIKRRNVKMNQIKSINKNLFSFNSYSNTNNPSTPKSSRLIKLAIWKNSDFKKSNNFKGSKSKDKSFKILLLKNLTMFQLHQPNMKRNSS